MTAFRVPLHSVKNVSDFLSGMEVGYSIEPSFDEWEKVFKISQVPNSAASSVSRLVSGETVFRVPVSAPKTNVAEFWVSRLSAQNGVVLKPTFGVFKKNFDLIGFSGDIIKTQKLIVSGRKGWRCFVGVRMGR